MSPPQGDCLSPTWFTLCRTAGLHSVEYVPHQQTTFRQSHVLKNTTEPIPPSALTDHSYATTLEFLLVCCRQTKYAGLVRACSIRYFDMRQNIHACRT